MIETERLILRRWQSRDHAPFLAMGNDPEVMRYLGPPQTAADVDAAIARQDALFDAHGHGFWALERRDDGAFLGFCGIKFGPEGTPVAGQPEIGWRLRRDAWGHGYAREAAQASLDWGWAHGGFDHVIAITVLANARSWGLMERLGMTARGGRRFRSPGGARRRVRSSATSPIRSPRPA